MTGQRMTGVRGRGGGRRRASLRTRLLTGLIGLTAVFLVVMGAVVVVVLGQLDRNQFNAEVGLASRESVSTMAAGTDGFSAAYLSLGGGAAGSLTTDSGSPTVTALLSVVHGLAGLSWDQASDRLERLAPSGQPFDLTVNGAPTVRAAWHLVTVSTSARVALPPGPAVIVVGRDADSAGGGLRGLVLTETITGAALIALLAVCGNWLIGRGLAPLRRMASTADLITSNGDLKARMPEAGSQEETGRLAAAINTMLDRIQQAFSARLRRMASTAALITSNGDLAARMPEAGSQEETGRLAAAINTMLDRIQQAFSARLRSEQTVRQFAADASHELRTPLTTIRGYAELYRANALGPGDLPNAMRRIEQEAERMSLLVAELLELARLDRPSSLDLTETDLTMLARDAVADARAVEPDREVRASLPGSLVVTADEPRIRQVLANLLGNVRAHTPPGTPAAVRLYAADAGAVIEVSDSGPGMSEQDATLAFDRFHRGTPVAERPPPSPGNWTEAASSGLGLSIVQAIAAAHGGQAGLTSAPGQGTTVRLWIPVRATR